MSLAPPKLFLAVLPAEEWSAVDHSAVKRDAAVNALVWGFLAAYPSSIARLLPIALHSTRSFNPLLPIRDTTTAAVLRVVLGRRDHFKISEFVVRWISVLVMNVKALWDRAAIVAPHIAVHVIAIRPLRIGAVIADTSRALVVTPPLKFLDWVYRWPSHAADILQEGRP